MVLCGIFLILPTKGNSNLLLKTLQQLQYTVDSN